MTTKEIFEACCRDASSRYNLDRPFIHGQHVYATDGHIAVRACFINYPDTITPDSTKKYPPVDKLPWTAAYDELVALPSVEPRMPGECEYCFGGGLCTGCPCGSEHDCGHCDGTGEKALAPIAVAVGSTFLSDLLITKLVGFGVTAVRCPSPANTIKRPVHPVFFKHGDFEGLVMPIEAPQAVPA